MAFNPTIPFDLQPLPPAKELKNEHYLDVLLKARTELGELNGYAAAVPNPLLHLSPSVIRESVASSGIENINTTVEQAFQMQLFPEAGRRSEDKEVLRYSQGVMWGFENLKKVAISTRLILGIHQRLMSSRSHGYRKTQNSIRSTAEEEIFYTPPEAQRISPLMGNWETYVNDSGEGVDPLVRIAAAHYQFEAIHPFADGNGRTGRILMVLSLINQKLLTYPILYISGYIKRNKPAYYRLLRDVSARGTWRTFIRYMLTGFYEQAKETKTTLMNVAALQEKMRERLRKRHPKIYTADLVEAMFAMPVLTPGTLGQRLDINYRTASRYLAELAAGGVLSEKYIGKYHLYANKALFALLKG